MTRIPKNSAKASISFHSEREILHPIDVFFSSFGYKNNFILLLLFTEE